MKKKENYKQKSEIISFQKLMKKENIFDQKYRALYIKG